ncbi:hypothetical protein E2542_SST19966 [Spatholobus suberectus]|nr:hypothetical protein E2542_SST19966 [Spatholobus suberectus]
MFWATRYGHWQIKFIGSESPWAQVHLVIVTTEGSRKLLAYYPSHGSPSRTLGETSAATAKEKGEGGSVMEEKEDRWGDRLECFERGPGFGPNGFEGGLQGLREQPANIVTTSWHHEGDSSGR